MIKRIREMKYRGIRNLEGTFINRKMMLIANTHILAPMNVSSWQRQR